MPRRDPYVILAAGVWKPDTGPQAQVSDSDKMPLVTGRHIDPLGSTAGDTRTRDVVGHPVGTPLVVSPDLGLQEQDVDE